MVINDKQQVSGYLTILFDDIAKRTQCRFQYVIVPRARAVSMFLAGQVDILPGSTQVEERDRIAEFVPLARGRVAAILLRRFQPRIQKLASPLDGAGVVNAVNSYDYGESYRKLLADLKAQGRLEFVLDPDTAVRKLASGRADILLAAPTVMIEAITKAGIESDIVAIPVPNLPEYHSGLYLSHLTMEAADVKQLSAAFHSPETHAIYWRVMSAATPAWVLDAGLHPAN
jgi:polar amino acid transport system substrate-binding protein